VNQRMPHSSWVHFFGKESYDGLEERFYDGSKRMVPNSLPKKVVGKFVWGECFLWVNSTERTQ
jgi:hypothetical protein